VKQPRLLTNRLKQAALILAWEGFWRLAWPIPALIALFAGVALLDLLPLLPPLWHRVSLGLFAVSLIVLLSRLRHFRWPGLAERQRRLERDNDLAHRPLSQWEDRPAGRPLDPISRSLWQMQRQRLAVLLKSLRLRPPAPGLPAVDPLGLRFAPLLLLAIGLAVGRHDVAGRFDRAFDGSWDSTVAPPLLQVWITPPAYTGLSPMLLQNEASETLQIPAGSKLLAELQGSDRDARLFIDGHKLSFTRLDRSSQKLDAELIEGSKMTVKLGRHQLAAWRIRVTQDLPPSVAFAAPPEALKDGSLGLKIHAEDDYGVTKLGLVIRRADLSGSEEEIALPAGGGKQILWASSVDLSSHVWSGLEIAMAPTAEDAAGHRSEGESVVLVLPERNFRHPVARAVAALRRSLARDAKQRLAVIEGLIQVASRPDLFRGDLTVFLQLVTARSRLIRDHSSEAIPGALDMMWAAAIRIEDGNLQNARDAVDQASQALADALAKGASDAEITRLTDQLNEAARRLIADLARKAQESPQEQAGQAQGEGRRLSPDQIQAMLNQLSDLAHAGAKAAAQQSLQALKNLLDHLSAGGVPSAAARQWREDQNKLQKLTEDQRSLLDHTVQRKSQTGEAPSGAKGDQAPSGAKGDQAPSGARGEQQSQENLRKQLRELRKTFPAPNAAPALGQAEGAMEQAEQALKDGRTGDAVDAEGRALGKLQEGAQQMAEAMAQSGQGAGEGEGDGEDGEGPDGPGKDPLGRALPGGQVIDDGKVKLPKAGDLGKSREILDELRRRAGDPNRSATERDYLRRLLDRLY